MVSSISSGILGSLQDSSENTAYEEVNLDNQGGEEDNKTAGKKVININLAWLLLLLPFGIVLKAKSKRKSNRARNGLQ